MADIVTLILAEHVRIRRLFAELEAARDRAPRLATLWAELAGLLQAHVNAGREIAYLPLAVTSAQRRSMREVAGEDDDIREAIAEARLHQAGSRLWWLAVRAVQAAMDRHIDVTESDLLPRFRRQVPERTRHLLGRQWTQFITALSSDGQAEPVSGPALSGAGRPRPASETT